MTISLNKVEVASPVYMRKMEMMPQAHLRGKGSHGVHRELVGPLEINLRFIEHR